MSEKFSVVPEELDTQDFELINWTEISKRGLLERINREIMHPLGLAVCRDIDTGMSEGALVSPEGKWVYAEDVDGTREMPQDPVQKLIETIDIKAQAGLCQFSHGGTRAFLMDIRALIEETREASRRPTAQFQVRLNDAAPAAKEEKYSYGQDGEGWFIVTGPDYPEECVFSGKTQAREMAEFLNKMSGKNTNTPQTGRAAELASHLRDQAKIFREEDSQARGASALEEAAGILESLL